MKKYVDPEYTAILLNKQDVIVTSNCENSQLEGEDCFGPES